jgi:Rhs element Vgr protein
MLAGTSGVGKTETALALAEALYGGEQNLITINMSEYQEAHTVSTLKGAPPGYVGYGEGGVLTEAVRRKPYSVVLLDEVEKAHPDVHEIFFQVFDKGFMEDGEGPLHRLQEHADPADHECRHRADREPVQGPGPDAGPDGMAKALREPLLKVFPPALLGRLVTIPYYPLSTRCWADRPAAAEPHQEARGGALQDPVRVRRRRGQAGGVALHRERVGRPHDRCDPDQHDAIRPRPPPLFRCARHRIDEIVIGAVVDRGSPRACPREQGVGTPRSLRGRGTFAQGSTRRPVQAPEQTDDQLSKKKMADNEFRIESDSPAKDDLMFWRIVGHEALARPSAYELTVLSKNKALDAKDILGHAFDVVIEFQDEDGGTHERHCQGHAVRFVRAGHMGRHHEYRITLRSWFWLLTKRANSRILQDKKVLEVLDAVFEDSPIKRFKKTKADNVIGTHKPRRYCVQHQESDYQFLSRLLEDEGIYYWFDAHDAPGTMHLSDASDMAHDKLPAADTCATWPPARPRRASTKCRAGSARASSTPASMPRATATSRPSRRSWAPTSTRPTTTSWPTSRCSSFPAATSAATTSENRAKLRGDELNARRDRHWALTPWPDVAAGRSFKFEGDPDGTRNGDYIIAACTFVASHRGYEGMSATAAAERRSAARARRAGRRAARRRRQRRHAARARGAHGRHPRAGRRHRPAPACSCSPSCRPSACSARRASRRA